ncbi:MAG: hypothetical protein ACYCW6_22315 [Candidatus Xenobia bacterium]
MIRSIWMGEVSNLQNDNTDVIVELQDGRKYTFTAFTPTNLVTQMAREGQGWFVCDDLLVVRELTEENVRGAVEQILQTGDIERSGIRATD